MKNTTEKLTLELCAKRLANVREYGILPERIVAMAFNSYVDSMPGDSDLFMEAIEDSVDWKKRQARKRGRK
jgi:hypothetical protein